MKKSTGFPDNKVSEGLIRMKILISTLLLFLSFFTSDAQPFYIKADGIYGFAVQGRTIADYDPESAAYRSKYYSYGTGVYPGIESGYIVDSSFHINLGLHYLLGSGLSYKGRHHFYTASGTEFIGPPGDIEHKAQMFQLTPMLTFFPFKTSAGIKPYVSVGGVLGLKGIIYIEEFPGGDATYKEKRYGGIALGFTGKIGAEWTFSKRLAVFGGIQYLGLNYAPLKGEVYEAHGIGMELEDYPTSQRYVEYVDEFDRPASSDKPRQEFKYYYPFSSIGINLGLKYSFGKPAKKEEIQE